MRNDTKIKGRPSGEDGGGGLEQSKVSTTLEHVRLNDFVLLEPPNLRRATSNLRTLPPYFHTEFPHRTTDPLAIRSHSQTTHDFSINYLRCCALPLSPFLVLFSFFVAGEDTKPTAVPMTVVLRTTSSLAQH